MGITDELRKWKGNIQTCLAPEVVLQLRCELTAIADRIDAEYQKAMLVDARKTVYQGYIELPKDADGEYTNADDEMFWKEDGDSAGRVTAIGVGQRAGWVWTLLDGCNVSVGHEAFRLRHHHTPTVEDVLREFAEKITDSQIPGVHPTYEESIAEYAAKLRLAGDAE